VNDLFYSLQGEGAWIGYPAYFIRLAGCNLNCDFCDTDYDHKFYADEVELSRFVKGSHVVITGGEPCMQDIQPLVNQLRKENKWIAIETNGTFPIPKVDWVTVSPKTVLDPFPKVDAIKYLCGMPGWEALITSRPANWVGLQPISKEWQDVTIQYCLDNPWLRYSCQLHKYLGIK
jgi:organic radical activating enzyme